MSKFIKSSSIISIDSRKNIKFLLALFILVLKDIQDDKISGAFRELSASHSILVLRVINTI